MKPRIGGYVRTPDGLAEYRGPVQPHGMALVAFPDGHRALYRAEELYVEAISGVATAQDIMDARVARLLAAPTVPREGD